MAMHCWRPILHPPAPTPSVLRWSGEPHEWTAAPGGWALVEVGQQHYAAAAAAVAAAAVVVAVAAGLADWVVL